MAYFARAEICLWISISHVRAALVRFSCIKLCANPRPNLQIGRRPAKFIHLYGHLVVYRSLLFRVGDRNNQNCPLGGSRRMSRAMCDR